MDTTTTAMESRRMKPFEKLQEYNLAMRDLSHKGSIDDSSLIENVINEKEYLIPLDAIIGIDFLQKKKKNQFTFDQDGIHLCNSNDDQIFVNVGNVNSDQPFPFGLSHISNSEIRKEVQHIVTPYKQHKANSVMKDFEGTKESENQLKKTVKYEDEDDSDKDDDDDNHEVKEDDDNDELDLDDDDMYEHDVDNGYDGNHVANEHDVDEDDADDIDHVDEDDVDHNDSDDDGSHEADDADVKVGRIMKKL
ncbi:protein PFC0760c-like [Stegodyphus dumicola]|uniref:protein PFC0760c-like n=1 Tax=Stegodyphus dumicola TaxID=202533 RepID=UPI0015B25449|nr:protein PFC0760c-like [Stegodyphus dumicola]